MNERLLTDTEMQQAAEAWEARRRAGEHLTPASRSRIVLMLAQDAKTRAATLREVAEWLAGWEWGDRATPQTISGLFRGEAPWEEETKRGH